MNNPSLRPALLLLVSSAALAGCGTHGVDDCVQNQLLVHQGVFGCTTSFDDVGNNDVEVLPGFGVEIFATQPSTTPDGLAPVARTESDEDGFYQIALDAGHVWICSTFRRCVELDIPAGAAKRMDYEFSNGSGWSAK